MRMMFYIKKIQIMEREFGTDKVMVYTDLPSPFPVGVGNDNLIMEFDVHKGEGIKYVKQNFMHDAEFPHNPLVELITKNGEYRIVE